MNAEEILARVAATYAAAAEYADTGEMTFNGVKKGEFRTSFVRASGRLVFEGVILGHRHHVDLVDASAVNMAIAGLTGVTFGAAHGIPRLLWPDVIGGRSILDAPASLLRTADNLAELVLTETMPRRLVVDTKTWLITAHELDATDQTTIATQYRPVL